MGTSRSFGSPRDAANSVLQEIRLAHSVAAKKRAATKALREEGDDVMPIDPPVGDRYTTLTSALGLGPGGSSAPLRETPLPRKGFSCELGVTIPHRFYTCLLVPGSLCGFRCVVPTKSRLPLGRPFEALVARGRSRGHSAQLHRDHHVAALFNLDPSQPSKGGRPPAEKGSVLWANAWGLGHPGCPIDFLSTIVSGLELGQADDQ